MPRSFLVKKKDKSDKRGIGSDAISRLDIVKTDVDVRPVMTEPLLAAVAPYTPLVQPMAVRFCNGKWSSGRTFLVLPT